MDMGCFGVTTLYHIEIPDQDIENVKTAGDIVRYVQNQVSTPVTNSGV